MSRWAQPKHFPGHSNTASTWTAALSSVSLIAVVATFSLHLMSRLVFAAAPIGGALGLLTLYGETAAIAFGLAALRCARPIASLTRPSLRSWSTRASRTGTLSSRFGTPERRRPARVG